MDKYFFEAFDGLKQLAPGSNSSTLRAAAYFPGNSRPIKILSIGCGTGKEVLILAEFFPNATITAIDNNEEYIKTLDKKIKLHGFSSRINSKCMSMEDMDFEEGSFDLIWSEGSIYIMGFKNGIHEWKKLLKPNGFLICSEISWLNDEPSEESREFWNASYPEIDTIDNKLSQIKEEGYECKGRFILPESNWTNNYYGPLQKNLDAMKDKYESDTDALKAINSLQAEIDLYKSHPHDYGYVFYAMKKKGE